MSVQQRIFIVTGLSGSGKTTALKALEDRGCEVIDNLPIALAQPLIEQKRTSLAFGIDVRTRDFSPEVFLDTLCHLRQTFTIDLLFFEACPTVIEKRYRETRRAHPLGSDHCIISLIEAEKSLLQPLRDSASFIFDTTKASPPEIRSQLFQLLDFNKKILTLFILSFSFRQGIPAHADFIFDVRFLKNPYYQSEIQALTGKDPITQNYLSQLPECQAFCDTVENLFLKVVLPCIQKEGRAALTIAFGCTGGRHRSVYITERLAMALKEAGYVAQACHRDLY